MAKIPNWTLEQVQNVSEAAEGEPLAYWTEDNGDRDAMYHYVEETFDETQDDGETETVTKRVYRGFVGNEQVAEATSREPCRVETVERLREEGEAFRESADEDEGYTAAQLEEMTKAELYEVAKDLDVEGRTQMNKEPLLEAVKAAALDDESEGEDDSEGQEVEA